MCVLSLLLFSCTKEDYIQFHVDNPEIKIAIPLDFPEVNQAFYKNKPTQYGVQLGKKLFNDKRLSTDNSISCASCHLQTSAYADNNKQAIGVYNTLGLRNTPPLQNLAFMDFYNWDGSKLSLEKQAIVPIITPEEMNASIGEVIEKLKDDPEYTELLIKAFGDEKMTPDRIYKSIAQFEYTLISNNSKYDKVMQGMAVFKENEKRGYAIFKNKCVSCHSTALFTDQSFRNIGFPINENSNEAGRARVTGNMEDYMSFRVPSLRNIEYTAPYGSFGQFNSLKELLDYLDKGVIASDNLDPIFKNNNNRIPLNDDEKLDLIAFMKTLSDKTFTHQEE